MPIAAARTTLLALLAGLLGAPAQAVVFDVVVDGGFADTDTGATEPDAMVTGFFEIDDVNGNNLVEDGEVVAWSFVGSGFNDAAFNITISNAAADATLFVNTANAVPIGGGLSAGLIDVTQSGGFAGFQIDFGLGQDVDIFNFNGSGSVFTSKDFSVTVRGNPGPQVIPAPPAFVLLATAGAVFAAFGARRRAPGTTRPA